MTVNSFGKKRLRERLKAIAECPSSEEESPCYGDGGGEVFSAVRLGVAFGRMPKAPNSFRGVNWRCALAAAQLVHIASGERKEEPDPNGGRASGDFDEVVVDLYGAVSQIHMSGQLGS